MMKLLGLLLLATLIVSPLLVGWECLKNGFNGIHDLGVLEESRELAKNYYTVEELKNPEIYHYDRMQACREQRDELRRDFRNAWLCFTISFTTIALLSAPLETFISPGIGGLAFIFFILFLYCLF